MFEKGDAKSTATYIAVRLAPDIGWQVPTGIHSHLL
jgi:hypothetical protein